MSDPGMELLLWAKGPGFQIAVAAFLLGLALKLVEVLALGRKADMAPAKGDPLRGGLRVIFSRFLPGPHVMQQRPVVVAGGYIFHIAFFVVVLFFVPHIALFRAWLGIGWPGLPSPAVEAVAVIGIGALLAVLACRLMQPVRRFLSTFDDYLSWGVTVLPLVTGVATVNKWVDDYSLLLALHILSVELLLVVFPFGKLGHGVTFLFSRYYNGAINGRKGAAT